MAETQGFLGVGVLLTLLLIVELFPPDWSEVTGWTLLLGIPSGLGLSFWRHKNEQHKAETIAKARQRRIAWLLPACMHLQCIHVCLLPCVFLLMTECIFEPCFASE